MENKTTQNERKEKENENGRTEERVSGIHFLFRCSIRKRLNVLLHLMAICVLMGFSIQQSIIMPPAPLYALNAVILNFHQFSLSR